MDGYVWSDYSTTSGDATKRSNGYAITLVPCHSKCAGNTRNSHWLISMWVANTCRTYQTLDTVASQGSTKLPHTYTETSNSIFG